MPARTSILFLYIALLLNADLSAVAAHATQTESPPESIDVFLLLGQSNMAGAAREHQLADISLPEAREDILYSYHLPRIPWKESSQDRQSQGFVPLDTIERTGGRRWGPELTLGAELADAYLPDKKIALIKFARGASNLSKDWNPDSTAGAQLYRRSLRFIQEQLNNLRSMGFRPELRGAFWFQGEGDSNGNLRQANAYDENLRQLIAAYRRDLHSPELPFIIARINPTRPDYKHADIVREAIVHVADADPFISWVNVDDLTFPDRVHVDGPGQFALGKRFAQAWTQTTQDRTNTMRPNILFLFAEQHHPKVLSPAGHPIVKTPHMQRLADEGVFFENAYCPTPLCMPSRTSTILGRFSHDTGIVKNILNKEMIGDQPNLPRNIQQAGYRTAYFGKTHLGTSIDDSIERFNRLGYEEGLPVKGKIGNMHDWQEDPYINYQKEKGIREIFLDDYRLRQERRKEPGGLSRIHTNPLAVEDYIDQWITDRANEWLENYNDERPFFLSVNWPGPHAFRDPPEPYASMYDPEHMDAPIEDPMTLAPAKLRERQQETLRLMGEGEGWRHIRAAYYGQITVIDDGIGQILDTLERKGLLDNTLIIYAADHGEMLADHGMVNKSLMYESSVAIPFIVRLPGRFPAGQRPRSLVSLIDLAPTLLEMAKAEPLPEMHGQSLVPVLEGKVDDRNEVFSEYQDMRMVRQGPWKYVTDPSWSVSQLFNLDDDPQELNNLIQAYPEKAVKLQLRIDEWLASTQP